MRFFFQYASHLYYRLQAPNKFGKKVIKMVDVVSGRRYALEKINDCLKFDSANANGDGANGSGGAMVEVLSRGRWRLCDEKDGLDDVWFVAKTLCNLVLEFKYDAFKLSMYIKSNSHLNIPVMDIFDSWEHWRQQLFERNHDLQITDVMVRYILACPLASFLWQYCQINQLKTISFVREFWFDVARLRKIIPVGYCHGDAVKGEVTFDLRIYCEPNQEQTSIEQEIKRLRDRGLTRLKTHNKYTAKAIWDGIDVHLHFSIYPNDASLFAAAPGKVQYDPTHTFIIATDMNHTIGY